MPKVKIPHGWTRKKTGRKIVYTSEPPRVQIWSVKDFDNLKLSGRFSSINREMLNFSSKAENAEDMDVEHVADSMLDVENQLHVDNQLHGDSQIVGPYQLDGAHQVDGAHQLDGLHQLDGSRQLDGASRFDGAPKFDGACQLGVANQLVGVGSAVHRGGEVHRGRGVHRGGAVQRSNGIRRGRAGDCGGGVGQGGVVQDGSQVHHGDPVQFGSTPQGKATAKRARNKFGDTARETAKVDHIVKQLTVDPSVLTDHRSSLVAAAGKLNKMRSVNLQEVPNLDQIRQAIQSAESAEGVLQILWSCPGVREFFVRRESCSNFEDLLVLSSSPNPLNQFPPNINRNIYSDLISFGLENAPGLVFFLLSLLVKKEKPVVEKDVVKIATFFASIAHTISAKNNAVAKTKTLLLQSHGTTVEGM